MKTIYCVGCGFKKEFEVKNGESYSENGFDIIFDVSDGLDTIPVCNDCYSEVRKHISAIEKIAKKEMWQIGF